MQIIHIVCSGVVIIMQKLQAFVTYYTPGNVLWYGNLLLSTLAAFIFTTTTISLSFPHFGITLFYSLWFPGRVSMRRCSNLSCLCSIHNVTSSSSSFAGFYNPLAGFSLLILEVSRLHTRTQHSR